MSQYDYGSYNPYADPAAIAEQQRVQKAKDDAAIAAAKMPDALKFNSLLGRDGKIGSQYQLSVPSILDSFKSTLGGVNINQDAYNAMKGRALSTGDSPWLTMQKQLLASQMAQQRDDTQAQELSGEAQARSALASKGGLSGGAAERLAMSGAKNLNALKQQNARAGNQQGINLNIADDQTKQALLGQVAGLDQSAANFDLTKANTLLSQQSKEQALNEDANKYNIGNALTETQNKRNFDLDQWKTKMSTWAANRTADAQENAGKK
jgi:hypothetical protein